MPTNPEIFKAYDIRGIYDTDLDETTANKLGYAYIDFLKQTDKKDKYTIVVAKDMRLSSPKLTKSLIKGLTEAGADVIDIGLASTPTFYFAVANFKYDGGIIISASHNPPEYNGFKLVREKAIPISGNTGIYDIRDRVMNNKYKPVDSPGKINQRTDVLNTQIKHDLEFVDLKKVKPFKVVVDPANGMGAQYIEALFNHLPGKLIKMNFSLDGTFPAHEADPFKEKNLEDIKKIVIKEKADFGIATDGDGDRIFFIADNGETIKPWVARAILCKIFLEERPGSKIAYDIRPGRITPETIKKHGGVPIVTKVGHSLIKEQTVKKGAYFAGESSGHFFLNMKIGCFEVPIIIVLKLLQEFSQSNKKISEYIKPYDKYFHSGEINTMVDNPDAIINEIRKKYSDGKLTELDIITIDYPDYWFNVRKSNTEPLLRFTLEAKTKKQMETKRDEILKIIRS